MSQSTARKQRRASVNGNGSAIENLPSIDDLLGVTEKAQQDAESLLQMAFTLRRLQEMMMDEKLTEADEIPNARPPRTFREQFKNIRAAYAAKWKRIDEAGHRANVQEILDSRG